MQVKAGENRILPAPLVRWAVFFYDTLGAQIFLHLAWLVCSVPLITAPAATIALNAMEWRLVTNDRDNVAAGFFREMKACLFSSFVPFLPVVFLVLLSAANTYLYIRHIPLPSLVLIPLTGFQVAVLLTVVFLFPLFIAAVPVRTCSYRELAMFMLAVPAVNPGRTATAVACFAPILVLTLATTVGILLLISSMAASMSVIFLSDIKDAPLVHNREEPGGIPVGTVTAGTGGGVG